MSPLTTVASREMERWEPSSGDEDGDDEEEDDADDEGEEDVRVEERVGRQGGGE